MAADALPEGIIGREEKPDGRVTYLVEPYQEVRLPGTAWVVYRQGDEEQAVIVFPDGNQIQARGPHDWTVSFQA